MRISKKYHFYAAHRNEYLDNKCKNLHGHTYYIEVVLSTDVVNESGVTILFEDIDRTIEPIIESYDHATLINSADKELLNALTPLGIKLKILDGPSSAENLSRDIYNNVKKVGLPVVEVSLKETVSSEVKYP